MSGAANIGRRRVSTRREPALKAGCTVAPPPLRFDLGPQGRNLNLVAECFEIA
jgi:hypothetical protein